MKSIVIKLFINEGLLSFITNIFHYWQTPHLRIVMWVIINIAFMGLEFQHYCNLKIANFQYHRLLLRNIRVVDDVDNVCLFRNV